MAEVERFTQAERTLHTTNALAVFFLLLTGGLIWRDLDHWRPGGLNLIVLGHVWLGGIILLLGGAVAFLLFRRRTIPYAEKRFNPAQRNSLKFSRVMLGLLSLTGTFIYVSKLMGGSKDFRHLIKDAHLYGAWVLLAFVVAHVAMVVLVPKNRGILKGMVWGHVDREVAIQVSPDWVESLETR